MVPDTVKHFNRVFTKHGLHDDAAKPAYGLAEYTVAVSVASQPGPLVIEEINKIPRVSCGTLDHFFGDVRVVNPETFHEMPEGEEGEIWVSGPAAAIGYWGQEEKSK